jgi:perosamine synthetase
MIGVGTFKITNKAREYVNQVLSSERLSYGYFTQQFERRFAAAHDCRFAVMTNSGTSSLQIALALLKAKYGWADGDEVIVPAVTFIATSNIVLQNNMKPVFVDVDPVYYEMDPALLERAITSRTRCIIPVHLFGLPSDMVQISQIATAHNLRMIEDSCETMFARLNNRSVGAWSDIGCFSTYVAHILTTGVGGLCTTNDPSLAIGLRSMMNHGRDSIYLNIDDDKNKSQEEMELIIQRRFSFVQMGYSYRVTELEGALGLAEFEGHEIMMQRRRENATYLTTRLQGLQDQVQLPSIREGAEHAFMMYPLVLRNETKRDLVNYLEQKGIETRDMLPLTNQPFYKEYLKVREDDFPVAKWINDNGFYVGCHQNITHTELDYIATTLEEYFRQPSKTTQRACLILMSKRSARSAQIMYNTLPLSIFDEKIFVEGTAKPANGSLDTSLSESIEFFRTKDFRIIRREAGKGELLREAIATTTAEHIVVLGTDGTDNPEDIPRVIVQLKRGSDLAIASRFMLGGGRKAPRPFAFRSLGNRFFSFLIGVLFDANVTDASNQFRGFRKSAFEKLPIGTGSESVMFEMTIQMAQAAMKISETPTKERASIQEGHKRNRVITGLAFVWVILRSLLRR